MRFFSMCTVKEKQDWTAMNLWSDLCSAHNKGPKRLYIENPIPKFCLWTCHGNSKGRTSEFHSHVIPNSELLHFMNKSSEFHMLNAIFPNIFSNLAFEIPNLCPWHFHGQNFGNGISLDKKSLGPRYPELKFLGNLPIFGYKTHWFLWTCNFTNFWVILPVFWN